jgi:hypothetical protein
MRRFVLPLVASLGLPLLASAADEAGAPLQCLPPTEWQEPPLFEPVSARPLTDKESRDLRRLFRNLDGQWRGGLVEEICMHSGGSRQRSYDAKLDIDASSDELKLVGDYVDTKVRTRQRFQKRLFLTPDGLRVDVPSRAGEVELLEASTDMVAYRLRYRHVLRRAATAPIGSAPVQSAVIGAGNLAVEVNDDSSDSQAPPQRASVAREERFMLRAMDRRNIEVTQQFFSQGIYTGSMTWRMRRN